MYYILRQVRKHDLHYLATLQSAQCSMSALSLLSLQLSLSIVLTATDLRDGVFRPDLVNISDIKMTGDQYIHTGMILTNVQGKTKHFQNNLTVEFQMVDKISKIVLQFKRMLHSLFLYSKGTPLHFIFLTDEESLETIKNCFKQEIGKYLSESIIYSLSWRNKDTIFKFPKLDVEFVDIDSVTSPNREDIERLKHQYGSCYSLVINPLSRSDLGELYNHFKLFSGFQVVSVATDHTVITASDSKKLHFPIS